MKAEKIFLPVLIAVVLGASVAIYLWMNGKMEQSLTDNAWCVETKQGAGTDNCKLIIKFNKEGEIQLTLEDGSQATGKWIYNGEVLTIEGLNTANHFEGVYSIQYEHETTPQLVMNSGSVALMAIGLDK